MKVAILKAKGQGGLQDPKSGRYISSKRDTVVPYTDWAESQVNHKAITAVEVLEESNFADYVGYLTEANGDEEKALTAYRKSLPKPKTGKDADAEKAEKEAKAKAAKEAQEARAKEAAEAKAKAGEPTETAPAANAAKAD